MLFAKFVTLAGVSPGFRGKIDYVPFPCYVRVRADSANMGQCAAGIHVIPLAEGIDFTNVIFTPRIIILRAEESDIVYHEGNGKMRLRQATALRDATDSERDFIRTQALLSPETALDWAASVDQAASNLTRRAACADFKVAYEYAMLVDHRPHSQTRKSVIESAKYSLRYATDIDQQPHYLTRMGACQSADRAMNYAEQVDRCYHPLTYQAVAGTEYEIAYQEKFCQSVPAPSL